MVVAAAGVIIGARALSADDLPPLKPGMWSFSMSIVTPGSNLPHTQNIRRCANPVDDIRKKWRALAVETCKFSSIKHDGKSYSYTSSCQKNGMQLSLKSVITVESELAYRVDTESKTNNQVRRETLVAKREGDCAQPNGHPPLPQPSKGPPHTS